MTASSWLAGTAILAFALVQGVAQEGVIKGQYDPTQDLHLTSPSLLILAIESTLLLSSVLASLCARDRSAHARSCFARPPEMSLGRLILVASYHFISPLGYFIALRYLSFATVSLAPIVFFALTDVADSIYSTRSVPNTLSTPAFICTLGFVTFVAASVWPTLPLQPDTLLNVLYGSIALTGHILFKFLSDDHAKALRRSSVGESSHSAFTSLLTTLIATVGVVVELSFGTLRPAIGLLLSSQEFRLGFLVLVGTSAGLRLSLAFADRVGEARVGAQLARVILNGFVFGQWSEIPVSGLCGVGWVASGAFIANAEGGRGVGLLEDDMDNRGRYKLAMAEARRGSGSSEDEDETLPAPYNAKVDRPASQGSVIARHLLPILLPLLLAPLFILLRIEPPPPVVIPEIPLFNSTGVVIEGGNWEQDVVAAIWPECDGFAAPPQRWPGSRRTALASDPRSGNTFVRELVERSTSFQTGTAGYCDSLLGKTLPGECDVKGNFLLKTHHPDTLRYTINATTRAEYVERWNFNQVVHLIRNPVDSLYSGWQLAHVPRLPDGQLDHFGRIKLEALGVNEAQKADVRQRAQIWMNHESFWANVRGIPRHVLRYEDLLVHRLPTLMSLLVFLLPGAELPSTQQVACALERNETREAYVNHTAKRRPVARRHPATLSTLSILAPLGAPTTDDEPVTADILAVAPAFNELADETRTGEAVVGVGVAPIATGGCVVAPNVELGLDVVVTMFPAPEVSVTATGFWIVVGDAVGDGDGDGVGDGVAGIPVAG